MLRSKSPLSNLPLENHLLSAVLRRLGGRCFYYISDAVFRQDSYAFPCAGGQTGAVNVKQLIGVINGLLTSHMILFCIPLLFPELSLSLFRVFRILTAWQEFLLIVPAFFSELFRLNT